MPQHHTTESEKAGRYVKREIDRVRRGEHGVRSPKQAIAIGLSEARRAGVKVPPKPGTSAKSAAPKRRAKKSAKRSAATLKALKREPSSTVSHKAMSKQAKSAAGQRGAAARRASARKAARTRARNAS